MKIISLILLLTASFGIDGQSDSLMLKKPQIQEKPPLIDRIWVPTGLATLSVTTLLDSTKYGLQELIRRPLREDFRTHIDDYIHYAPLVMMYTADLAGVKSRNTAFNQTKYLVISEALTAGIMLGIKYGLGFERPDGTENNSYPSGHTSQAFCQAQVFYNEYRDTHPLFAASGHIFSISTATLRVLNNRHWVPDVLLGAGLGIFITNMVYRLEPLKNWDPWTKWKEKRNRKSELMLIPELRPNYNGFRFSVRF